MLCRYDGGDVEIGDGECVAQEIGAFRQRGLPLGE
jgi:hypothetical protein